jgi:hypothetical protein
MEKLASHITIEKFKTTAEVQIFELFTEGFTLTDEIIATMRPYFDDFLTRIDVHSSMYYTAKGTSPLLPAEMYIEVAVMIDTIFAESPLYVRSGLFFQYISLLHQYSETNFKENSIQKFIDRLKSVVDKITPTPPSNINPNLN